MDTGADVPFRSRSHLRNSISLCERTRDTLTCLFSTGEMNLPAIPMTNASSIGRPFSPYPAITVDRTTYARTPGRIFSQSSRLRIREKMEMYMAVVRGTSKPGS